MSQETTPWRPRIAIIGGGITGVCLAIGLLSRDVPVCIYEAASAFGEIGAGVVLGPSAIRAMSLIDPALKAALDAVAPPDIREDTWVDYRMGMAGEDEGSWIASTPRSAEGPTPVHRATFLAKVVELIPEGVAQFRKRLTAVEGVGGDEMLLRFDDGITATADAVVGCDGIRSRCRRLVLGETDPAARAVFSGKYAYRGLVPMDEAVAAVGEELVRSTQLYCGRDGHVVTYPVQKSQTLNIVAVRTKANRLWEEEAWVVPAAKQEVERDFAGYWRALRSLIGLMRSTDAWALFHHWPARTYLKGRLCLAGDAAHATTPHMGSGAGMGIEDAWLLSELLAGPQSPAEVEAAFEAYDYVRRPRTQKLVTRSQETAEIFDFQMTGVWDDCRAVANAMDGRFKWVFEEDLSLELAKAKQLISMRRDLTKE